MGVALQQLITGWISCATGRDELAAVTTEERDGVLRGEIPCPACRTACGVTFKPEVMSEDMQIVRWREGQWIPGFYLR